ncbi:MAG: UbiA-like protein EboC [Cytophagaceae bacterium]|nr:UbiA-like protein EboC [Cytophagaceae bacterium]
MGAIAYIRLMRPANIPTALADILYGFAASGIGIEFLYGEEFTFRIQDIEVLYWLLLSSFGLYTGGLVMNDVFDYKLDKVERPERPLPSGSASLSGAVALGCILIIGGVLCGFKASLLSGLIATLIAVLALYYNKYAKHHVVFGPVCMGGCRSANLMLGMSFIPAAISELWFLYVIPFIYIIAITLLSQGEVNGMNKKKVESALLLLVILMIGILNLAFMTKFVFLHALPFIILFLAMVLPNFISALKNNDPLVIRKAVKTGILALIVLDASLAAGFAGIEFGLLILLMLPLSFILAKGFSVT